MAGGVLLPNVNLVLQITGSIGGTIICVVIPFILYHKAYEVARDENRYTKETNYVRNILSYIMLMAGLSIGIFGLGNTIYNLID